MDSGIFREILIWLVPCVSAVVVHEVAHGWMAARLGDPTARDAGRLSLNPIRHIDPIGTFLVPGLMLLVGLTFVFGWARPVPVNFQRLKNIRSGTVLVAAAGPLSNFVMMFCWLAMLWSIALAESHTPSPGSLAMLLAQIAYSGVVINVALMTLNLIPLPPLDGGRIVGALLPEFLSKPYMRLERYGIFILMLLIVTGIFDNVFVPLLKFAYSRLGIAAL
jgi:Zn-dependent protease